MTILNAVGRSRGHATAEERVVLVASGSPVVGLRVPELIDERGLLERFKARVDVDYTGCWSASRSCRRGGSQGGRGSCGWRASWASWGGCRRLWDRRRRTSRCGRGSCSRRTGRGRSEASMVDLSRRRKEKP